MLQIELLDGTSVIFDGTQGNLEAALKPCPTDDTRTAEDLWKSITNTLNWKLAVKAILEEASVYNTGGSLLREVLSRLTVNMLVELRDEYLGHPFYNTIGVIIQGELDSRGVGTLEAPKLLSQQPDISPVIANASHSRRLGE
ncbi:MAG: hypothetical protein LBK60_08830 [Verrucomicrobiales bacterium]|jgi:hypothetical protein|nr:hypothetical protein [Verrucomicrobiales bacterium]